MLLDSRLAESPGETEKEREKQSVRNKKKELGRNRDFRHVTNNEGKGKKIVLIIAQEKDTNGNTGISCRNKKEIEQRSMNHNREHLSKVEESKVHTKKIHTSTMEDDAREKMMIRELNREDFDEDIVYEFLCLLKRRP